MPGGISNPSDDQLQQWAALYSATPETLRQASGSFQGNSGQVKGILLSSPLVQGTQEYRYTHDLLYSKKRGWDSAWPLDTREWVFSSGRTTLNTTQARKDQAAAWGWNEALVGGQSYAGVVGKLDFFIDEGSRPLTSSYTEALLQHIQTTVNGTGPGQGLFAALIPNAPNGFVIASAKDFDEEATNGDGANAGRYDIGSYWRSLNQQQPLDHLYSLYYSTDQADNILASNFQVSDAGSLINANSQTTIDLSADDDPYVLAGGPFSNTNLLLGDGNNVVALSPVMTPAFYRLKKLDGSKPRDVDAWFASNTILYPSSVGRYLSNDLTLGNGNNIVYYDSSLAHVSSGSGHNVFLPSFGSFNWSIDWLHTYQFGPFFEYDDPSYTYRRDLPGNNKREKPLISPIPWDLEAPNPAGKGSQVNYTGRASAVADLRVGDRNKVGSQGNLYTVNVQDGTPQYLRSFFNGKLLQDGEPFSYNPINRIGGVTIRANGGDNTFYGMDWRLYEGLLPSVGVTTANQLPDPAKKFSRAAVNAWQTMYLFGGPGSNYFFLGDIVDDITNNAVFYDGTFSYVLSLTHGRQYQINELNRPENSRFGNAASQDGQKPLSSVVNLNLQADPTTIRVITQQADPGSPGTTTIQEAGAWNGLTNALNKAQGNGEKAISSYADWIKKGQTSSLLNLARFASKAVPWVDFGVAAVSATIGLINLFKAEPKRPPQQEITATYTSQSLNPARKAVLINDWHPYARININLPGTNPNAWDTLSFNIKKPTPGGSNNESLGAYLELTKAVAGDGGDPIPTSFPLVVLDHVDREDAAFGYYSYNFLDHGDAPVMDVNLDQSPSALFSRVGADNLRLFGTLPNPANLIDSAGKTPTLIPGDYTYLSTEDFDMRNDAANHASFNDDDPNNFYTRYYFGDKLNINSRGGTGSFPAGWDASNDLYPYSPVISLEFDSRSLGWYWQPVLNTDESINFDSSKLWIKNGTNGDWKSYSFLDLNNRVEAYRHSLMASTFYYLDGGQQDQRQELIDRANLYRQLYDLEQIMPDLSELDQSLINDTRQRLVLLQQISKVEETVLPDPGFVGKAFKVSFDSENSEGNTFSTDLIISRDDKGQLKALPTDDQERLVSLMFQRGLLTTPLAEPLLQFVNASRFDTSGTAASLLTPINLNADLFADTPSLLTGNYGFEGYIGIPGMDGTDASSQQIAASSNVAWNSVDPTLNASQRAYTSAVSTDNASRIYGVDLLQADNMPLVFSHPLLPTRLNPSDFVVTLSDGSRVTPQVAAFLPNLEFNERQTVVISGEFGNRLQPGEPGALFPVSVTVVNDGSPLELLTADGPVSAVGLTVASTNPYVAGNGPTLLAAKLNRLNNLGEGGPIGVSLASQNNSGLDLYGTAAQYRLRLYTSAGFSPDGISSLLPSEFSRYFLLEATAADGSTITIDAADTPVQIGDFGSVTVLGLADLAQAGTPENAAYVEDHDNYYDIILAGDAAAIARLSRVRMPSSEGYQAVFNPGGPGNDPDAAGAAPGPFTVASSDQSVAITQDLDGRRLATFVEVDGAVLRNPFDGRPIGSLLGVAVEDTATGQRINAYSDPQGLRFYASFAAAPDQATDLPDGLTDTRPIDLLDTRELAADTTVTVSGSLSRSASYASSLQFYAVVDGDGTVLDPVSGQLLTPSDPGYQQAALSAANLLSTTGASLSTADGDVTPFSFQVQGGQLFAPVLTVADTRQTYFSFAAANADRISHFHGVGPNAYGIEDLAGGGDRDFDDQILRFTVTAEASLG